MATSPGPALTDQAVRRCCRDCLTEDVTVKVIDQQGFEHWFCAADWEANCQFGDAIRKMLESAVEALHD